LNRLRGPLFGATSIDTSDEVFGDLDYIVVSTGSAGCVVSNRLSADVYNKVLPLEGRSDQEITALLDATHRVVLKAFHLPKQGTIRHGRPDRGDGVRRGRGHVLRVGFTW
jgi:choline dehydrogenase-like flavoprotein